MERKAVDSSGLTPYEPMQRAGEAALQATRETYPNARHWLALCSYGNNGGDGYVIAGPAKALGLEVTLLVQKSGKLLPEEARHAHDAWFNTGGVIHAVDTSWSDNVDVMIDALTDTGLKHAPRKSLSVLVGRANSHPTSTAVIDTPFDLLVQTGATPGVVINAAYTIISIVSKPGLLTGKARGVAGRLYINTLGLGDWLAGQSAPAQRFDAQQLAHWLAPRRSTSHKGSHSRLVIIGGDHGTAGVIRMAGEAALRAGAGLVKVLMRSENIAFVLTAKPELMVDTLTPQTLEESLTWADVVVIGPGLGQQEWGKKVPQKVGNSHKLVLWDVDALNLLTINPDKHHNRVITPHPDKAARLLGRSIAEIGDDHLLCAQHLAKRHEGVVVLRGAGTVIATEQAESGIINVGNAGVANGGMGGVLSDIIGTSLGQKLIPYDTACAGCVTRGVAADVLVMRFGTCDMPATDLSTTLQRTINPDVIDVYHDESSNSTT